MPAVLPGPQRDRPGRSVRSFKWWWFLVRQEKALVWPLCGPISRSRGHCGVQWSRRWEERARSKQGLRGRQDRTASEGPSVCPGPPSSTPPFSSQRPADGSEQHRQAPYFPLPQLPHRAPTILDRKAMQTPGPRGLRQTSPLFAFLGPFLFPPPRAPLRPHPILSSLAKTCHRHHHTREEINK